MRFYTQENLDLDWEDYEKVRNAYSSHLASIRRQLPLPLYQLHRHYSLHDAEVAAVLPLRNGKDLGILLDGFTNYDRKTGSDRCTFFLHFIGCTTETPTHLTGREWRVVELDITEDSRPILRILHYDRDRNAGEDEIVFNDFDFYLRDSREWQ